MEKYGRVEDIRVNLKLTNEEFRTFSFNIEAEYDQHKNIVGTNGIIRDITKQALYEEEIIKIEAKFRNIFESFSDIYYRSDENAIAQIISPSVEQVSGYKPEEVLGQSEKNFHRYPKVLETMQKLLKEHGSIENLHGELIGKDNRIIVVSVTSTAFYDSNGKYAGANGIIRDITEQKNKADWLD